MVFTFQIRKPHSVAGRCWNVGQELVSVGALALIVLKLTGVIHWSWWWVLSPLWISGALVVLGIAGVVILIRREAKQHLCPALLAQVMEEIKRRQARP